MRYPREIILRSSARLMAALWGGHFFLGLALLAEGLPVPLVFAGGLGLLVSALMAHGRAGRLAGIRLDLREDGSLHVAGSEGPGLDARPSSATVDLGWAIWLGWRAEGPGSRRQSEIILLLPDGMGPADWRALRIWLRFKVRSESGVAKGS